jgi:hypothetical protein
MKRELQIFAALMAIFVVAHVLPLGNPKIQQATQEAFRLLQWYARNHTLACVVPALFIAGAIIIFLSKDSVMRYLGPNANKPLAYAVASVIEEREDQLNTGGRTYEENPNSRHRLSEVQRTCRERRSCCKGIGS